MSAIQAVKPLSLPQMIALIFLRLFRIGGASDRLSQQAKAAARQRARAAAKVKVIADLDKESILMADILQAALTRLGEAYTPRAENHAAGGRRDKIQRVQFEDIKTQPEIIWLKIATT